MPNEVKLKLTYLDRTIKPVCLASGTASSSTRLTINLPLLQLIKPT